jgi:galactonate dehydratase
VKITRFEILKVPPSWVWLKIHTDEGIVGLGEPYLEPVLLGKDPRQVEQRWWEMYQAGGGYKGGPVTMSAISGIDIALWDIAGKAAGQPIYQMLGGACRDRIRMYRAASGSLPWTVEPGQPYRAGRPASAAPASLETWAEGARILTREWGFRCLKVHFGPGEGLEVTSRVERFAEQFAAVREGAGPDVDVAVDIHNPHPAIAAQLIELLAPHRPLFIEEPMPVESVDVLADLARRTSAPIAAGERWMGKWIFFEALSKGALSVLQPDICHAGGITECYKIGVMGQAAFAKVALHCPLSPLSLAASVQLDATLQNFLVQEHNEVNDTRADSRTYIGAGYLKDPFVLDDDGCIAVPSGPGLGVELDEDGLARILEMPWDVRRG